MGERIHTLRIQHNMSMDELGKRVGVGKTAIFKYENNQVENIPRSTIEKMSVIFGVSPSYIMCFDEWDKNSEVLSDEVTLIERVQAKWGKEMVTIIQYYCELNEAGQETLRNISESLTELNKYKK
jgi:transcriptional regulator with XRE-family HTH domain